MSPVRLFIAWKICRGAVHVVLYLLYRIRHYDRDRVPRTGPIIYLANHQSHLDPPGVGCVLKDRPCAFLARSSLFSFKPFGVLIAYLNSIPLNREGRGTGAFRAVLAELEAGRCVLVFPEGTRCRDGRIAPFKPGYLLLVRRSGATVVPCAIEGAHDCWPVTRTWPRLRGRLAVQIGEPLSPEQCAAMSNDELTTYLRRTIDAMRLDLRARLREETKGRFPPPGPADAPLDAPKDEAASSGI
jgi:1-acyl-sn-glycerol-3-phosphate acyltransferase